MMNNFKEKWLGLENDEKLALSDTLWLCAPIIFSVIAVIVAAKNF